MAIGHLHISSELGNYGEEVACNLLVQKGYRIIERNWRIGAKEIDVIAEKGEDIVFVEVKSRTSNYVCRPEEFVDIQKQRNVVFAANAYIKCNRIVKNPRFDIIGILFDQENAIKDLAHIENAFYAPTRTINSRSFSGQYHWKKRR